MGAIRKHGQGKPTGSGVEMIDEIVNLAFESLTRGKQTARGILDRIRDSYDRAGISCTRVGLGNSKTCTAATYRPVGVTCSGECPWIGAGCYAQTGRVALAERHSLSSAESGISAAVAAAISSLVGLGVPARLHVSGDFGRSGEIHAEYLSGIASAARMVRDRLDVPIAMWGFTRFDVDRDSLWDSGVAIRVSGRMATGGAVIAGVDVGTPSSPHYCGTSHCADCAHCWTVRDSTVVLSPRGSLRRHAHGKTS